MPVSNPTEIIDSRILRLIGLEDVFDLDYDTYLTLLKEAMVKGRMTKKTIPTEEVELLTNEYKRVKTKKDQGRFTVKKKKISTGSFSVGNLKGVIAPAGPKGLLPASAISKSPAINKVEEDISAIAKSMNSIADILAGRKKLTDATAAADRRKAEQDKRALAESKLEKRFDGLKKAAEKIIAPVKSILDRIIDFFVTVFLGRVVYKLLEWFGDPKNADKVKSIFRFLGDQWPKLLTLYLVFGNAFGRFALGLAKGVAAGAVKLAFAIAKLLAAKKVKGAMGAARFLGGGKGKLLANVIGTVATVGGAYALTQGMKGDGGGEQKTQNLAGGGYVRPRFPTFSGGGFNFKGMLGGAGLGAMFGPLGMLVGGALGSGKPQEMMSGFVSGEKGVDKVPAMLSDGEFVMSRGAVAKYGVDTLESMNAAGGGTNKPKIMGGTTYAQGGGLMGENPDPNYKNPGQEKRLELMKALEEYGTNVAKSSGDLPLVKAAMNLASVLSGGGGSTPSSGGGVTGFLSRVPGEAAKMLGLGGSRPGGSGRGSTPSSRNNIIDRARRVPGEVARVLGLDGKPKPKPGGDGKPETRPSGGPGGGFDFKGFLNTVTGASQEAVPALLASTLGMSPTDTSISQDMQKQILDAMKKAQKAGKNKIDYSDYGSGMFGGRRSAAGLTMGMIGMDEFKRDEKGRIIGLRQIYDTSTTSEAALKESGEALKQFVGNALKGDVNFDTLMKGIYKAPEALLAATQHRGTTMHDVNFDEKVLGFKPGKEVLNDKQRRMIAAQKNREALQSKRPFYDLMGFRGGASAQIQREQKERQEFQKKNPGTTLYGPNDPRRKSTSYQSRFARPKNAGVKPVPPPVKPKPKITVVNAPGSGRRGAAPGRSNGSNVPNFGATNPKGGDAKAKTLGLRNRRGG